MAWVAKAVPVKPAVWMRWEWDGKTGRDRSHPELVAVTDMFAGSPGMTQQRQKCLGRADVKRQSALGCAEGPMGTSQARRKPEAMAVPGTAMAVPGTARAKTKKRAVKSGAFEKSQDLGYDAG